MNIICDKNILNENITSVSKAVSTHSNIPVLEGIFIKAEENGCITLIANDMEMGIEAKIEAEVKESGQTVLNARMFSNIIKNLPAGISKNAEIVYNIMSDGINELDEIKRKSELEVRHILVALTELEMLGFAEAYAPNCYRIK